MVDLTSLIERVEKASGPDRELDVAVDLALFPDHRISGDHILDRMGFGKPIPHYTASLDAVMALMPDGHGWLVGNGRTRPDEPLGGAQICSLDGKELVAESEASTPVLALLSAILRARQAMEASE
jgi:hypothetical protein